MENKFLVVVDIQPGYHSSCHLITEAVVEKINNSIKEDGSSTPVIFFYVGRDLDVDSKDDVIGYLLEHGLEEEKIRHIRFIEKGYGFYRAWMDQGVSEEIILNAAKLMKEEEIYDSRDFEHEHWVTIAGENYQKMYHLFDDNIYYPDFNTKLILREDVDNFELIGGGRQECLKEIELFLKASGKTLTVNEKLCYGDTAMSYETDHKALKRMRAI